MNFEIITIMPQIFDSVFGVGIIKRAIDRGLISIRVHDLRDYTTDKHRSVDDTSYGGGVGMVFKVEPIDRALKEIKKEKSCAILLSASGKLYNQEIAESLLNYEQIILICCRYEGCDERVAEHIVDIELSIGDYILHGGEIATMVVIESVSRLIPGVLGKEESLQMESFRDMLLDYPHYTRPADYKGALVPEVLLSGNHEKIYKWRLQKALEKTLKSRPDLIIKMINKEGGERLLAYLEKIIQKE